MVYDEGSTDVATLFHWIYVAVIVCWNSGNLHVLELQLGLVVPINCNMFVSVRSGSHKL